MMDDLERWQALAARVTMRPAWPHVIRWRIEPTDIGPQLHVELEAPDIVTGERQTVHQVAIAPVEADDYLATNWACSVIRHLVMHELDECLLVDGKQVRDPHARDIA